MKKFKSNGATFNLIEENDINNFYKKLMTFVVPGQKNMLILTIDCYGNDKGVLQISANIGEGRYTQGLICWTKSNECNYRKIIGEDLSVRGVYYGDNNRIILYIDIQSWSSLTIFSSNNILTYEFN